ncbi:MAG: leucine-rich repeat domain-containing protein [Ruminococcaceae bacterium]|nr:leucine-rich repeat domain-containing protein [Oscillospiraceae bacterium]
MKKRAFLITLAALLCLLCILCLVACDESSAPVCQHRDADDNALCDKCSESYTDGTDASGSLHTHAYGEWIETTPATCVTKGIQTRACSCGQSETQYVAELEHLPSAEWKKDMVNHWKVCVNGGCRLIISESAHTYNLDNVCVQCGYDYADSGVEFKLINDGYVVTRYTGSDNIVIIPSTYKGTPIVAINEDAFNNYMCSNVTSVVLSDGITSIGDRAFSLCRNLISITIPNGVTKIGAKAFQGCENLVSITIPNSVVNIREDAFEGCNGVIQKENGVSYVDKWIVDCDDEVMSVTLRDNSVGIANYAFWGCGNFETIVIPDSVRNINPFAFSCCDTLTQLVFGKESELTSIGYRAFYKTKLASIVIPNSVTNIAEEAFCDCDYRAKVYYGGTENTRQNISIGGSNGNLTNFATWFYYSDIRPSLTGNWWYYDSNEQPAIWQLH